ncbi:MAG TPA: hypothetical protein VE269_06465 [Gaiellaceae bacterium]|nr:hypothetical protein [Gaiellaceae bacterium]
MATLRDLLEYMSTADSRLNDVHVRLIALLGRGENVKDFARQVLQSPPELVCSFVAYLATPEASALELHAALSAELAEPDHATWWRDAAFAVNVDTLAYMLSLMAVPANGLAVVRKRIIEYVCAPQHAAHWRDRVLRTDMGHAAMFLRYAGDPANGLTPVADRLTRDLASEHTLRALAISATIAPLHGLASFLSVTPLAASITGAIDEATWTEVRSAERHPHGHNFMALVKQLKALGRDDLLAAPAAALIHSVAEGAWPAGKVSLNYLASVIALAEPNIVDRSFHAIVTPSWLEREYATRTPLELAHGLLQMLFSLPLERHSVLSLPSLGRRVESELNRLPDDEEERLSILALIGAADLAGMPTPANARRYPAWADRIVLRRAEANGRFRAEDALRWAALRALARIEPLRPDPAEGEIALAGWACFTARTPFAASFNRSMVAWLERSRRAGWTLVAAPPVRDEVVAALG